MFLSALPIKLLYQFKTHVESEQFPFILCGLGINAASLLAVSLFVLASLIARIMRIHLQNAFA